MIPAEGSELLLSKAVLQKWCIRRAPPLTPCLIPVQSSALCLLRDCMWPTVCLLVFLRAPGLLCPLCIKAKLHFLWWLSLALHAALCTWGGCLNLAARWEGHPTPSSDLFCPFRLFQRIWREVRCPERSDGQGKLLQRAVTSDHAEQPGYICTAQLSISGHFSSLKAEFCAFLNL